MNEYIITENQLKTAMEACLKREIPLPITNVFISGDKLPEIVRCRDCRYASAGEAVLSGNWQHGNCHNPRFRGSLHGANARADGFCAWGVRKEDA